MGGNDTLLLKVHHTSYLYVSTLVWKASKRGWKNTTSRESLLMNHISPRVSLLMSSSISPPNHALHARGKCHCNKFVRCSKCSMIQKPVDMYSAILEVKDTTSGTPPLVKNWNYRAFEHYCQFSTIHWIWFTRSFLSVFNIWSHTCGEWQSNFKLNFDQRTLTINTAITKLNTNDKINEILQIKFTNWTIIWISPKIT